MIKGVFEQIDHSARSVVRAVDSNGALLAQASWANYPAPSIPYDISYESAAGQFAIKCGYISRAQSYVNDPAQDPLHIVEFPIVSVAGERAGTLSLQRFNFKGGGTGYSFEDNPQPWDFNGQTYVFRATSYEKAPVQIGFRVEEDGTQTKIFQAVADRVMIDFCLRWSFVLSDAIDFDACMLRMAFIHWHEDPRIGQIPKKSREKLWVKDRNKERLALFDPAWGA